MPIRERSKVGKSRGTRGKGSSASPSRAGLKPGAPTKTERVYFADGQAAFVVQPLTSIRQLAVLRERSKRNGNVDKGLLMVRVLEMGVLEPPLDEADVLLLMKDYPDRAALLAIRIVELTTGS